MTDTSPHSVCVISNPRLRRMLQRTLQAAGSTVEFCDQFHSANHSANPPRLIIVDDEARKSVELPNLSEIATHGVIVLGSSLEDAEVIALLREHLDHVISDIQSPDETELVVTSVKLLSGDIFGLDKYLAWGVKVHDLTVSTYEEKRIALLTLTDYARSVGARRQVVAKVENVADELLMNAMYDAPAVSRGLRPQVPGPGAAGEAVAAERALLRYACDGRYFALSVEDRYGELEKTAILDHLSRARNERGRPRNDKNRGGAGLGLYFILSSVTRFIANVTPGERTEVVCLFDLRQSGRDAEGCARSLHVFRHES